MSWKNTEERKAWIKNHIKNNKEKYRQWQIKSRAKKEGITVEQYIDRIKKNRERVEINKIIKEKSKQKKWAECIMPSLVLGAITEIERRILLEKSLFRCVRCKQIKGINEIGKPTQNCKDCKNKYNRKYQKIQTKKQKERANIRNKQRRISDKVYKLKMTMRRQTGDAIRNYCKVGYQSRTGKIKYLGCTIPELKLFLESKFNKRMTWENHGKYWHIDHIRPLASFNLLEESEMLNAFNYQNLQPLEASKNLSKSARWWPNHTQTAMIL